jgi:polyisoprenoid-binding protein YceI
LKFFAALFMKTLNHFFTVAACLAALAVAARAEDVVRYRAKPIGSVVHIDGAANIHEWKMEGTLIGGYLEVPAGVALDSSQAALAGAPEGQVKATAEVSIPVTSIKNGKYEGMDEVMEAAMDAPDFPRIQFHLKDMTLKQPHAAGTPLQFDITGELAIKGVTNKVLFPISIENADKGKLKITAAAIPVKMTDYGIKPPVTAGVFVTEPDVKISFTWSVGLPAKAAN